MVLRMAASVCWCTLFCLADPPPQSYYMLHERKVYAPGSMSYINAHLWTAVLHIAHILYTPYCELLHIPWPMF